MERIKARFREASERVQALFGEYGALALVVWYVLFGLTIGSAAAAIELGVDWPWLEEQVGGAGTWVAAYAVAKVLFPVRVAAVAAILPFAARLRRRFGRGGSGA